MTQRESEHYGSFDSDRGKRRAVSYVLVTASLVATYVGIVVLATKVLPFSSSIGVAASTLAVAALFYPVARLIQRTVDSRFNRAH